MIVHHSKHINWVSILLFLTISSCVRCNYKLTILHNNDFHSRFAPTTIDGSPCDEKKQTCIAGVARTVHEVERIRNQTRNDVLFMAAGDFFQGSLWYTSFKHTVISDFVTKMGYDVISLGNHEFDDKLDGLLPFINETKKIGLPVVCANFDFSIEPRLKDIKKSYVFEKGNHKIGVIGYLTGDTKFLSSPDDSVHILDEIDSIRKEVEVLKAQNVDIFIALGHSGFWRDQEIARSIPEIDIVVGGHTNSFLWNEEDGPPPSKEKPVGKYPTIIQQPGGKEVLVVSAYAYGKYLGNITVDFDDSGNIVGWSGKPILLDQSIPQDTKENLTELVAVYQEKIEEEYREPVGESIVFLEGVESACRMRECNMGNFMNDALVYAFMNQGKNPGDSFWTKYPIALWSGGGVRTSYNATENKGIITLGDLYAVTPFENTAVSVTVKGKILKEMFEHSMSAYDPEMKRVEGRFLQVSGIKVVYDASKPIGQRVIQLKARCGQCEIPVLSDVEDATNYTFITSDYLARGGDGYDMLVGRPEVYIQNFDMLDVDILKKYLKEKGVAMTGVEERITILTSSAASLVITSLSLILTTARVLSFVFNNNDI